MTDSHQTKRTVSFPIYIGKVNRVEVEFWLGIKLRHA